MQVALIPPKGLEKYTQVTRMQMALAHIDYPAYREAYSAADFRGDYIILDNGAAELSSGQTPFTNKQLWNIAFKRHATELVLPDSLRNMGKTQSAVIWFFSQLDLLLQPHRRLVEELSFMAVIQGKSMAEFQRLIAFYAEKPRIKVLGIPRLLVTSEHKAMRLDLANWINDEYASRFTLHLLGTSPTWVSEIRAIARYAPFVRSVDTSLPFNYALAGEWLDGVKPALVARPPNYFEADHSHINKGILQRNIDTLLGWAHAETPTC